MSCQCPVRTKSRAPCCAGVNLSVAFQKSPLAAAQAVARLIAAFPDTNYVKIFDWKSDLLDALVAAGYVDIVVAVTNWELAAVGAADGATASAVVARLAPFVRQGVHITLAVGNEPLAPWYNNEFTHLVVPALERLRGALTALGYCGIDLTVPFDASILAASYPPQNGAFDPNKQDVVVAVAQLLRGWGSPFFINFYPFFAYQADPVNISLDYALLATPNTVDGVTYPNMLAAFVAAVRSALLRVDPTLTQTALPIVIGETGWPTFGVPAATVANAQRFATNATRAGIPLYLFEAFDEGNKPGDEVERNFGALTESGEKKG